MCWIQRTIGSDDKTDKILEDYKIARNNFEIIESLLSKYTIWKYRNLNLLKRIKSRVEKQYLNEKQILLSYYEHLLEIYANSLKLK